MKEDYCSLLSFIICIGIAIVFELFLGVSAFAMAQKNRLSSSVGNKMLKSMEAYNQTGHEGVTKGKAYFFSFLYGCVESNLNIICSLGYPANGS